MLKPRSNVTTLDSEAGEQSASYVMALYFCKIVNISPVETSSKKRLDERL
jgi:hypothetical protein